MPSSVELVCVDPSLVDQVWPHVRPLIKRAIDKPGLSDFAHIEKEVLAGLQLVWLASNGRAIEAAAVTQLVEVSGRRICILVACGGKGRDRWLPLLGGIEAYAKAERCAGIRIGGRKGWERVLSGYRQTAVILEKELS